MAGVLNLVGFKIFNVIHDDIMQFITSGVDNYILVCYGSAKLNLEGSMKKILSICFILAVAFSFSVCKKLDKEQQAFEDTVMKKTVTFTNFSGSGPRCSEIGIKKIEDKEELEEYIKLFTLIGGEIVEECPKEFGGGKLLSYCIYEDGWTEKGKRTEVVNKLAFYKNLEKSKKECKLKKGKFYPAK